MILQAHGQTPRELFEHAARQYFDAVTDLSDVGEALQEKVAIDAPSREELLKEWVDTLGVLVRDHQMLFSGFRFQDLVFEPNKPCSLRADLLGELLDRQRHQLKKGPEAMNCRKVRLSASAKDFQAEIFLGTD